MENKAPIKITVKIPIIARIEGTIKDFFRKLSGGQYCCNYKVFFDYECEYCYTRKKPKPYPKDVLIQSDPKTNIKSSKDVLIIDHPLLVKER